MHMKFALTVLALIAMSILSSAASPSASDSYLNMFNTMIKEFSKIICNITEMVRSVVGVIAILLIVFAGASYVFSSDNPSTRKEAKEQIKHVLIGLVIIIVVKTFVDWIAAKMLVSNYCNT